MPRTELVIGKVRGDNGKGVAIGGTAGQTLVKKSATDYDTEWKTLPLTVNRTSPDDSGNVSIDTGVMKVNDTAPTNGNVNVDTGIMGIAYNTATKTITKTAGNQTENVVSAATLKTDMALNNVNNTSDADKPISTAMQSALDKKVNNTDVISDADIDALFE